MKWLPNKNALLLFFCFCFKKKGVPLKFNEMNNPTSDWVEISLSKKEVNNASLSLNSIQFVLMLIWIVCVHSVCIYREIFAFNHDNMIRRWKMCGLFSLSRLLGYLFFLFLCVCIDLWCLKIVQIIIRWWIKYDIFLRLSYLKINCDCYFQWSLQMRLESECFCGTVLF